MISQLNTVAYKPQITKNLPFGNNEFKNVMVSDNFREEKHNIEADVFFRNNQLVIRPVPKEYVLDIIPENCTKFGEACKDIHEDEDKNNTSIGIPTSRDGHLIPIIYVNFKPEAKAEAQRFYEDALVAQKNSTEKK